MGWSHPDISLEDLMHHIKGFVDILILASGYQSSGSTASWDAHNIKKAIRWGLFFEEVFRRLPELDDNCSVEELDAVLCRLTSEPHFPPGLRHLSSTTLSNARDFVLEHLLQTLPLSETHLIALLTAGVEMDLEDLSQSNDGNIDSYVQKLALQTGSSIPLPEKRNFMENSIISSWRNGASAHEGPHSERSGATFAANIDKEQRGCDNNSSFMFQELLNRQALVACLSSAERSMDTLLEVVAKNSLTGIKTDLIDRLSCNNNPLLTEEMASGLVPWEQWRSRSLSYLLDKRTSRLLSGASLIFSASKDQWEHIFEPLKLLDKVRHDSFLEIVELVMLGFVSDRWKRLIEHLTSFSGDYLPISEQQYKLNNLLHRSQLQQPKMKALNSKENDFLEYLTFSLDSQQNQLWRLPPILVAAVIPSCPILFKFYLNDIERLLKGESSPTRCCTCNQDSEDHKSCEAAERLWCLHMLHVQGSCIMVDDSK